MLAARKLQRRPAPRPLMSAVEALESRRLLSTYSVNGTPGADLITLTVVQTASQGPAFVATVNGSANGQDIASLYDSIYVNGFGGNDTIRLEENNNLPTTLNGNDGDDVFDIQYLGKNLHDSRLSGQVALVAGAGADQAFIYDDADTTATSYIVYDDSVEQMVDSTSGLVRLLLSYNTSITTSVQSVTLRTGPLADVINVGSTRSDAKIFLNSAGGNDVVNVGTYATGNATSTNYLSGELQVQNDASGYKTTLNISDVNGTITHNAYVDAFTFSGIRFNQLSGLSPASIFWDSSDVSLVNITTGTGADNVTVRGLDSFTNITNGGFSADHFHVGVTSNFSNLKNIVQFYGGNGPFDLDLNDSSETSGVNYSIGFGQIAGSFPGGVHWDVPHTLGVTLSCGAGDDHVDVYENRQTTRVNGGGGNDVFSVDSASADIGDVFDLAFYGNAGADSLFLDDRNQAVFSTSYAEYVQTAQSLTKTIKSRSTSQQTSEMTATYDGTLEDIYWRTSGGSDQVKVQGTPVGTRADFNNWNGNDSDTVGLDGSVQGLLGGRVYFHNDAGTTVINVDDSADTTSRVVNVLSNTLAMVVGLAPAEIDWDPNQITSVTVRSGTGNDQYHAYGSANVAGHNRMTFDLGGGDDAFTVHNFDNFASAAVAGNVNVIGGAGNDRLFVDNTASTATDVNGCGYGVGDNINQQTIDASNNYHLFRVIDHSAFETLQLTGGQSNDTIFANCIQPNVQLMQIDGGGGDDHIEAEANPVGGVTLIRQSGGIDNVLVETNALPGVAVFDTNVTLSSLTITNGGTARIADVAGIVTPFVAALNISGTGRLDLTDNALAVDYVGTSPAPAIRSALASGYANGAWTGNGIYSSTAAATPGRTVGYAEASAIFTSFNANFFGRGVDSTSVLLTYTLAGDTNLNRAVTFDDLLALSQNYGGAGKSFTQGDFTYDGMVNFDDLLALSQNYGASLSLADSAIAAPQAATSRRKSPAAVVL